jgi:hypothetical protein
LHQLLNRGGKSHVWLLMSLIQEVIYSHLPFL